MRSALAWAMVLVASSLGCGDNLDLMPSDPRDAAADDGQAGDDGGARLPDLTMNVSRLEIDLAIGERQFAVDSCELDPDEACIAGPGLRRLLHFSVESPNVGDADMILGQPNIGNDAFEYSACHDHFHFSGYAAYELLAGDGSSLAVGRKQAFCLLDTSIYDSADPTVASSPKFSCSFQGIQRGWADLYHSRLPCQFLDITDIPDGDYTLRVELNRERGLEEKSYANNIALVPVTIGAAALATPTEVCPSGVPARDSESESRECGWRSEEVFACTPGNTVSVGCSQSCGSFSLGECTGDPMLRVCDATRADGNCSYPAAVAANDDACGAACPIAFDFTCPASGMLEVFAAPRSLGQPFTCNLEVFES